jgi:hypothetical protein
MRPMHPGEVLREEYLAPLARSVNALAMALGVPATRIHEIVKEQCSNSYCSTFSCNHTFWGIVPAPPMRGGNAHVL